MSKQGEFDDAAFVVTDASGPKASIDRAASFLIGEGPPRRKGDMSLDPVLLEKRIMEKGEPRARLFMMSNQDDAQAYADLEYSSKVDGLVSITKIRELIAGAQYALFICWIEYSRPEDEIREEQENELKEKKADFLRHVHDQRESGHSERVVNDGKRCMGVTAKGNQCSLRRKDGMPFCRTHAPGAKGSVPMDSPPPTHQPLGNAT